MTQHLRWPVLVLAAVILASVAGSGSIPSAAAQQPAAPPRLSDGIQANGPLIELRASDIDEFTFVPPPAVVRAGPRTATFQVNYSGFTAEAQTAFQYAVDIWASLITSPVPIVVNAN